MGYQIAEDEIPEYFVRCSIVRVIETADGTGRVELLAPGHHPKCRVCRDPRIFSLNPGVSVEMEIDLETSDGTDLYTALDTGTTDYEVVDGTRAAHDNIVEREEGLYANVAAAGTDAAVLLVVDIESVH